ncbi:UNVERIFIED_CONTAM: hypothetical protein GTU68_063171 [Idotea baltica]|nr:hypothetical protein [Idotea baltica]
MDTLKESCGEKSACKAFNEKFLECNDRVNSRSQTAETCTEELFDYLHCVDHCVRNLFLAFVIIIWKKTFKIWSDLM